MYPADEARLAVCAVWAVQSPSSGSDGRTDGQAESAGTGNAMHAICRLDWTAKSLTMP
jgi:hypothetical protein